MRDDLYFDKVHGRPLRASDGGDWRDRGGDKDVPFWLHPSGVPVFLSAEEIAADEYSEGDPYGVAAGFEGAFQVRRRDVTTTWVREACPKRAHILDVGCGEGHITEALRRLDGVEQTCGVDYSVSAVVTGAARYPDVEFAACDAHDLPYADGCFDVVLCNNLWEHVETPMILLAEMRRTLRPGGSVLISTPSRYSLDNVLNLLRRRGTKKVSPHHVTEYTVGQMREMLEWGGFELVRFGTPAGEEDLAGAARAEDRVVADGQPRAAVEVEAAATRVAAQVVLDGHLATGRPRSGRKRSA